jgi:predicted ABC-type transport system involved in lysophospholipase L1 biosynthesis ATPase subunit
LIPFQGQLDMTACIPLIQLENISRTFDNGAVVALCDVSFSTYAKDCVAILGKSGSGKSTLIHVLSGCDEPTSGMVYWRGEPVRDQRTWRMLRATQIGIVFQEFHLLPTLTAMENVELALMEKGISSRERKRQAAEQLARVGLETRMHHLPAALSGGERQRVAIARSIANKPSLLLANEPTGNLDTANAASIMDLLLEIQQTHGTALVLATHDESLAVQCRRRVMIKDGRIVSDLMGPQDAPSPSSETADAAITTTAHTADDSLRLPPQRRPSG